MQRMPRLVQTVTYWTRSTPDGFGGYSWTAPVQIKAHWEDRTELFVTSAGQSKASRAIVYLESDVEEGGYLFLGNSSVTNPTTLSGAWEIMGFRKIPSVDGLVFERRAIL